MKNKDLIKRYADVRYPIVGDYNTNRYGNDRMNEYIQKELANVIELSNGMLCGYDKPILNTRFCFSDEGSDFELYKDLSSDDAKMKSYFLSENMKEIDEIIDCFEDKEGCDVPCIYNYGKGLCRPSYKYFNNTDEERMDVSDADKKAILDMMYEIRADFIKRLETWWKKYGAKHLHTWTYWADR